LFRGKAIVNWLDGIDPGAHRRIKGLRLARIIQRGLADVVQVTDLA
jgi:hypothetical protein